MGSKQSKRECETPAVTTSLEKPWRKINWKEKKELINYIQNFRPSSDEVNHVRILLYGLVGSGKSSFANSVSTVVLQRSAFSAPTSTGGNNVESFTIEYTTHKTRKEKPSEEFFPFVFCDTMGLERTKNKGALVEDIKHILKGNMKEGYKFNPYHPLSVTDSQYYNPCPSEDDKVHLLACVINGNYPEMNPDFIENIKLIRDEARNLRIPHVAIFTHIDQICKEIADDVKNVFKIEDLMIKVREFSAESGFDESHVFPVRNYTGGPLDGDDDMDTLILSAFKHMLQYADDFINVSKQ